MSRLYGCKAPDYSKMTKEEATLHKIFDIYSVIPGDHHDSCMRFMNLTLMTKFVKDLSCHSHVLKDVDGELMNAFFALVDRDCDGKVSFREFSGWWRSEFSARTRYHIFEMNVRPLVRTAWRLYTRFSIGRSIPYRRFEYMMEYLKVHYSDTDFDVLDLNSDGVLSFAEFCDWLNWF